MNYKLASSTWNTEEIDAINKVIISDILYIYILF